MLRLCIRGIPERTTGVVAHRGEACCSCAMMELRLLCLQPGRTRRETPAWVWFLYYVFVLSSGGGTKRWLARAAVGLERCWRGGWMVGLLNNAGRHSAQLEACCAVSGCVGQPMPEMKRGTRRCCCMPCDLGRECPSDRNCGMLPAIVGAMPCINEGATTLAGTPNLPAEGQACRDERAQHLQFATITARSQA